jgi:uncharacterized membrane protein
MIGYPLYKALHVVAVLVFVGGLLSLLLLPASPDLRRRRLITLWVTGCAAVVALVAGFGLHARLGGIWQGWVVSKIVVWLILLGAVTHFRRRAPGSPVLAWSASVLVAALAVVMAIYKPF